MQIYQLSSPMLLRQHLARHFDIYSFVEDWDTDDTNQVQRPPTSSPKGFFFHERENVFQFDGQYFHETIPAPAPFALLGVQSCDLTAIAYQDQFFADDPYYQARRQQALLIGIDCIKPCEQGFCYSVNAGPGVDLEYADIILHRLQQDHWLMLVTSDKGKQATDALELTPASATTLRQREENLDHCEQQFRSDCHIHAGIAAINQRRVPDEVWGQMGLQCLSCSGCTVLCPTCSCYGTHELVVNEKNTVQQRFWDSCLYESFQREASQHNPGIEPGERVRRFWTHKFGEKFAERFGRYGCVGCGRCEQTCPGVIGVHSVMRTVAPYANTHTNEH